jgi:hypothetical protein
VRGDWSPPLWWGEAPERPMDRSKAADLCRPRNVQDRFARRAAGLGAVHAKKRSAVSNRVVRSNTSWANGSACSSAEHRRWHKMVLTSGKDSQSFGSLAPPNFGLRRLRISSFRNSCYWPMGDVEASGLAVGSGLALFSGVALGCGLELGELVGDGAGVALAEGAGVAC